MTVRSFERAVVAGYAELPVTKRPTTDTLGLLRQAVTAALGHAGFERGDVDGLAVGSFTLAPDHAVNAARALGLTVDWLAPQEPGGPGAISACMAAARAVEAGDARVAVCVGADALDSTSIRSLMADFSTEVADWLTPIGAHPANVSFALLQDRYMNQFNVSREEIGRVAVLQRANGARNPQALLKDPITLDEYLNAPPVVPPLHLYDTVHPGSGASAIVICEADVAPHRDPPRLLAGAERHHHATYASSRTLGWESFASEVFTAAGVGRDDLDALELYDDYPVMVLWQLEELGFCEPGTGARFVADHDLSLDGPTSLNTGGGMLSVGQAGAAGGYVPLAEAVRQLVGEGGDRQKASVDHVLVSGLGMVGYGMPLSVGALLLGRR